MVILRNLKRTDNIIECDYYPENGDSFGHIAINVDEKEYVEAKCVVAKEDIIRHYFGNASIRLLRIAKTDDFKNNRFKDEYMAAWC